jgi:hypothetical protein
MITTERWKKSPYRSRASIVNAGIIISQIEGSLPAATFLERAKVQFPSGRLPL